MRYYWTLHILYISNILFYSRWAGAEAPPGPTTGGTEYEVAPACQGDRRTPRTALSSSPRIQAIVDTDDEIVTATFPGSAIPAVSASTSPSASAVRSAIGSGCTSEKCCCRSYSKGTPFLEKKK